MEKRYKIMISVIALAFSIGAACLGYALVGDSSLNFTMRFIYNFFFVMQFLVTLWLVIMNFRKPEKKK